MLCCLVLWARARWGNGIGSSVEERDARWMGLQQVSVGQDAPGRELVSSATDLTKAHPSLHQSCLASPALRRR